MLTLEEILEKTMWVGKTVSGYRLVGNYEKVKGFFDNCPDEFSDMDICAMQPPELKDFYDKYLAYGDKHGFITIQDYYNKYYTKEA